MSTPADRMDLPRPPATGVRHALVTRLRGSCKLAFVSTLPPLEAKVEAIVASRSGFESIIGGERRR